MDTPSDAVDPVGMARVRIEQDLRSVTTNLD
jgi:hypothetical protein